MVQTSTRARSIRINRSGSSRQSRYVIGSMNRTTTPRGRPPFALFLRRATQMPAALERKQRLCCLRRNLLFTLRLSCHETDANQFREEGCHFYLDRHDRLRLYGRHHGLRPLKCALWFSHGPLSKAFASQGASIIRASAALKRKIAGVRTRARALGCAFPPLCIARKKWADMSNNEWRD
jgi:hypothetical protein